MKLGWDDEVPPDLLGKWKSWLEALSHLSSFNVPRCIKPFDFNDTAVQLHHFCDASLSAYGVCTYVRCTNKSGRILVNLLLSKCKVAPIKPLTIPRLELQGAVLAAHVDKVLLQSNNVRLTDESLSTLFCEVECVLNSRPLTKVSAEACDLSPITPNHFLLMRQGPSPPVGVFSEGDMFRKRWRYVQFLSDQFWKRWLREYLPELQRRHKWVDKSKNLKVNDLVLLCDENTPRGLWPLGIVVDVMHSRDGLVRSVKVKTKSTVLVRPITKVVLLEGE